MRAYLIQETGPALAISIARSPLLSPVRSLVFALSRVFSIIVMVVVSLVRGYEVNRNREMYGIETNANSVSIIVLWRVCDYFHASSARVT